MTKERYLYLEPCDERMGSWGDMGTEISAKVWLSGGELKVNQNTWFAHFFRVGGLGFPYPDGGRKERAKARGRDLWLNNKWPKQIYPLSWLIERFKPLPDWHTGNNPVLEQVNTAGEKFHPLVVGGVPSLTANSALSHFSAVRENDRNRKKMAANTVSLTSINDGGHIPSTEVDGIGNKLQIERVATSTITAEMVQDGNVPTSPARQGFNQPCVDNAMDQRLAGVISGPAVALVVESSGPVPASIGNLDLGKESDNVFGVKDDSEILLSSHDSVSETGLRSGSESRVERDSGPSIITQKPVRKTCLYYTCNSHDPTLELAARANLKRATNGHEIGCVALKRTDFGDWTIVLDKEKSGGTMHYQILAGLERSTADYVFLCESDVFYSPFHFEFTPPDDSVIYYNTNVWRIRWEDGHAVRTTNLQQVSGICANRKLLLGHYRKRVGLIALNGGQFDVKSMAYEPGTRGKFGDEKIANWESPYPNLDITGHGQTLTKPKFSVDEFRNPKFAEGWQETNGQIEGWPLTYGRVQEWLKEMVDD